MRYGKEKLGVEKEKHGLEKRRSDTEGRVMMRNETNRNDKEKRKKETIR